MSRRTSRFLLSFVVACCSFPAVGTASGASAVAEVGIEAREGVLDLRGWSPEDEGPAQLRGDWHFRWQKLLGPEPGFWQADSSSKFLELPSSWNGHVVDGVEIGATGYATFGLRVLVDPRESPLVLYLPRARTAQRLFVNGVELARSGVVGVDARTAFARRVDQRIALPSGVEQFDLVLHVSNHDFRSGGADKPFELGLLRQFDRRARIGSARSFFLIGGFLMLAFYHLVIFTLRPQLKAALVFAVLTFVLAAYQLTSENEVLDWLWPSLSWGAQLRIEYLLFACTSPLMVLFFRQLYPRDVRKVFVAAAAGAAAIFAAAVLVTPTVVASDKILSAYQLAVAGGGVYGIYLFMLLIKRRRPGAIWFFVGFVILVAAYGADAVFARLDADFPKVTAFAFTAFVAAQAVMLASFVKGTLEQSETLAERLLSLDRLKDEFLASTSHELRTPLHAIIGLTDSLRSSIGSRSPREIDSQLRLIESSGRRLSRLVDDILDFSKLRNRDLELSVKTGRPGGGRRSGDRSSRAAGIEQGTALAQ